MDKWINQAYLDEDVIYRAQAQFNTNKPHHIQLANFFKKHDVNCEKLIKHYVANMHSYNLCKKSTAFTRFLKSKQFTLFISSIVGRQLKLKGCEIQVFGNKDYTLLHDSIQQKGIYVFIDFTEKWDEKADGQIVFVDNEEVLTIPPSYNTISIVDVKKIQFFTKYINCHAKTKKVVIQMSYSS